MDWYPWFLGNENSRFLQLQICVYFSWWRFRKTKIVHNGFLTHLGCHFRSLVIGQWSATYFRAEKRLLLQQKLQQKLVYKYIQYTKQLHSGKLKWQWKIPIFKREYIFKRSIFHCHFSLPECTPLEDFRQKVQKRFRFFLRWFEPTNDTNLCSEVGRNTCPVFLCSFCYIVKKTVKTTSRNRLIQKPSVTFCWTLKNKSTRFWLSTGMSMVLSKWIISPL